MSSRWASAKLSEVCSKISDGTHHSPEVQYSEPGPGRFKYITSKNIRLWGLDLGDIAYVDESVHREIYARCKPELGDVLLTKDGANTGNVTINSLDEEFSLLSSVALLKPRREILDPRFLRYFIESPVGSKRLIGEMTGTAIRRIILKKIKDTEIPVAPLPEQRRIVAEIEKQFTRLEAGVAALRRVQANLKRYRAAVLKAACEGRLVPTEAELARAKGPTKNGKPAYETGEALLARILAERRKNWKGRGQYKDPAGPDISRLPSLPHGWTWTNIEQLRVFSLYGPRFSKDDYAEDGYIVLRTTDISESGKVDASKAPRLRLSKDEFERYQAKRGDLLVTRTGSLGTLAIFEDDIEAIPGAYLIQFRLAIEPLTTRYLFLFLKSSVGQSYLTGKGAGVGRPNLNAPTIEALPVPLPPLAEQARIVAEVDRCLSTVRELEAVVSSNLKRAERLRQSILREAFAGELC